MNLLKDPCISNMSLKKNHRLGGGTYGRVYEATTGHSSIGLSNPGQMSSVHSYGEVVAVKENFISPKLNKTIGSIRELDILNVVKNHPYCIQLKNIAFEVPYSDGLLSPANQDKWIPDKVFFVLEKGDMDGSKYIQPLRLVNERKLFAVQVLLGIEYMHSRGIYHRDIKPQNIICFMNSHGDLTHAKLCDFGLSSYYTKQVLSPQGFVTLWYRAPEIALMKEYDYKVDVWSMGCILYQLFSSGNRVFVQASEEHQLINTLIEKLAFPLEFYALAQQIHEKITRLYDRLQQDRRSIEQQLEYTQSQVAQFNSCQLGGKPNSGSFSQLVNLIEKCLIVDPKLRCNISEALNHVFFDGFRELIDQTRTLYGINHDGVWTTRPQPSLITSNSKTRARGAQWFNYIYTNRMNLPFSDWYSHRIFLHALEMFDRYINLTHPGDDTFESDIVVWVNTFMFMSAKYFRIMIEEYGFS